MTDTHVSYDLDVRTYESLRQATPLCPRILVLLVLPLDEALWVSQSPEELIMRRCAWWMSLRGLEAAAGSFTARVNLPRTQVFSPEAVRAILDCVSRGEEL